MFQIYVISPFFATVMMRDPIRGQELWGNITAYSGYITAILCPFFGAIADRGGPRKPWLALFTLLMVVSFAGTWFGVADSTAMQIFIVSTAVVINNIVFEFSNAFHGAMLSRIAPPSRIGGLSGLSYALGSGAGFILMLLFLVLLILPGAPIHLPDHVAERLSGPISAVWMLVFAVPLFLFTPDRPRNALPLWRVVRDGIVAVISTLRSLKHYSNVAHYIGARTLFNDGLTGVLAFSGIYIAGTFHLDTLPLTVFGLLLVFSGTLGGFLGGWLDDKFGSKAALLITVGGTALSFGIGLTMGPDRMFWIVPVDPHAAANIAHSLLRHLAEAHLRVPCEPERHVRRRRLCQQPHHARAHRAGREDDRVLRADVALGNGRDLHRAGHGVVADLVDPQPARRHGRDRRVAGARLGVDVGGKGRTCHCGDVSYKREHRARTAWRKPSREQRDSGRARTGFGDVASLG